MLQLEIAYFHPDTEDEYNVTATILFAAKVPQEPFSRFKEPEDEDEVIIDLIRDLDGNEFADSDFEPRIIQDMRDHCFISAVGF